MRILPISHNINRSNNFRGISGSVLDNPEYKLFMKEIDSWTSAELNKIHDRYEPSSAAKLNAIEFLFSKRESLIERKKAELFKKLEINEDWMNKILKNS